MESQWQFGYAFAVIDGSHLPIKCPPGGLESMKQYHNFKNFYFIILFAIVDANYRIWANFGAPRNTHDSILSQSSQIWKDINAGYVLPQGARTVQQEGILPINLGDGAFPMKSWLLKPYGNAILTAEQSYFNYRLGRSRMVTEGAFRKVKGRFRVLHRKCESQKDTPNIMALA